MMHLPVSADDEQIMNQLNKSKNINGDVRLNLSLSPHHRHLSPESCLYHAAADSSKESSLSPDSRESRCQTPEYDDPWALPELQDKGIPWDALSIRGKCHRIMINCLKLLALLSLLYFFICSLDFLSSAFRLLGGKAAGKVMSDSELLKNPVVGLMIGVLVTVLVQSSSTSTSIVVTMVGSDFIKVRNAIPIVMGANIGTSVTNTIVSLMQSSDRNEFRRAFAAATVHDMFNWLTVIILLPLEVSTHYLEQLTDAIMDWTEWRPEKGANKEFLTVLTKPFTSLIIELDKKVLNRITMGNDTIDESVSLIKKCCGSAPKNSTGDICIKKCDSLMSILGLSDSITGIILLVLSLIVLCVCLILMVKLLHSMLKGQIAVIIKKTINAEYDFPYSVLVNYLAIFVGCIMTILVQSSSIFTSALTPLAGIGVISLERMYPLTLGSNIGTTTTGILAALTADSGTLRNTLQLAFCHLFFNLSGILIFYPIPFMRFPITLAKMLGNTTAKYRWFSVFYLISMFFLLPLCVFGLSIAGSWALICIGGPIFVIFLLVIVINIVQSKKPNLLPLKLQNWNFLPLWMHSLQPIDSIIVKLVEKFSCLSCCIQSQSAARHDASAMSIGMRSNQSQLHILGSEAPSKRNSTADSQLMHVYDNGGYYVHWNGLNGNGFINKNNESTIL